MATYYRGATLDVSLTITDAQTGFALDLTGAAVKFRLGTAGATATKEYTMTLGGAGSASVSVPAADTVNYNGPYTYTVHVTEASTRVFIAAQGSIMFTNTVLAGV